MFIFGLCVGAFVAFLIAAKQPDFATWVYDNTLGRVFKGDSK